jgi:tripeptide aminopeptidase
MPLERAKINEPEIIAEQIRICEIPAPPFGEEKRGLELKAIFTRLGLKNVRIDPVGNVLGERPGKAPRPHLVMAAHLDTVFPIETDVKVTKDGPWLKGPGIGDDCRGLAVLIGVVRALERSEARHRGPDHVRRNVGEEGLGTCAVRRPSSTTRSRGDRPLRVRGRIGPRHDAGRGGQLPLPPRCTKGPAATATGPSAA